MPRFPGKSIRITIQEGTTFARFHRRLLWQRAQQWGKSKSGATLWNSLLWRSASCCATHLNVSKRWRHRVIFEPIVERQAPVRLYSLHRAVGSPVNSTKSMSCTGACYHPHCCERKQRRAVARLQIMAERTYRCTTSLELCDVEPFGTTLSFSLLAGQWSLSVSWRGVAAHAVYAATLLTARTLHPADKFTCNQGRPTVLHVFLPGYVPFVHRTFAEKRKSNSRECERYWLSVLLTIQFVRDTFDFVPFSSGRMNVRIGLVLARRRQNGLPGSTAARNRLIKGPYALVSAKFPGAPMPKRHVAGVSSAEMWSTVQCTG